MNDHFETAKLKLVTIIASFELGARLTAELRELGASGYTTTKANGWGRHGTREYGIIDGANVRIESLVHAELAQKILHRVATNWSERPVVAFAQEVEAVPRGRFLTTDATPKP